MCVVLVATIGLVEAFGAADAGKADRVIVVPPEPASRPAARPADPPAAPMLAPSTRPAAMPSPSTQPAGLRAAATQPAIQPGTRPATQPSTQPVALEDLAAGGAEAPASGAAAAGKPSSPTSADAEDGAFDKASRTVQQQLKESLAELRDVQEQVALEKLPLTRKLNELEAELKAVRREFQQTTRTLDTRTLSITNLNSEIDARKKESLYLSNLLSEYVRNFESGLHIAEKQRYQQVLADATLATENTNLSQDEVFEAQLAVIRASLGRLEDALGGTMFGGEAVDENEMVKPGTFVMVGPKAIFGSDDGRTVGTVMKRVNSDEPSVVPFANPEDAAAARALIETGDGHFPLDPTEGNAHKVESTEQTVWEHIQKGGPVMVPILGMAAAALLVALYKWLSLVFLRTPSQARLNALLNAVRSGDEDEVRRRAARIKGPVGKMLDVGVQHLREPRELIEEVMFETVLATRLKLQRFLPFIAIAAASAPLLGLLGTVTGIINTFRLITVYGSGDVKTLSGGISEALITTEFGLIVAIPSLLLHAFLSRKARSVVDQMEKAAVAFVNQVSKSRRTPRASSDDEVEDSLELAGV